MNADRTEELIAKAIAALPCSRPSAGFKNRVMAEVAARERARDWQALTLKAAGILLSSWAALLGLLTAGALYRGLSGAAALLAQPGDFARSLKLMAAHGALLLVKLSAAASLAADMGRMALAAMPPFYEIAAAALVCAAVIRSVSGGRAAVQRI